MQSLVFLCLLFESLLGEVNLALIIRGDGVDLAGAIHPELYRDRGLIGLIIGCVLGASTHELGGFGLQFLFVLSREPLRFLLHFLDSFFERSIFARELLIISFLRLQLLVQVRYGGMTIAFWRQLSWAALPKALLLGLVFLNLCQTLGILRLLIGVWGGLLLLAFRPVHLTRVDQDVLDVIQVYYDCL